MFWRFLAPAGLSVSIALVGPATQQLWCQVYAGVLEIMVCTFQSRSGRWANLMYHRDSSFIAKCRTVRHDLMSVPDPCSDLRVNNHYPGLCLLLVHQIPGKIDTSGAFVIQPGQLAFQSTSTTCRLSGRRHHGLYPLPHLEKIPLFSLHPPLRLHMGSRNKLICVKPLLVGVQSVEGVLPGV